MKKQFLWILILSLLCAWTVAGADTPDEEEASRVAEKIRLTEEMNLTPEQAEALKDIKFLEANPGYKDELDVPPTILVTGDDCSDPFIIPESFPYSTSDNTCDYANLCDISGSDNSDVIYELTITSTIGLTVSLCGSLYDTKLAIYTPTCCSGDLDYWQYNDDSCGLQSEITATFAPGTYYIVVDGYSANCGVYTLNITEFVIPTGRCCYGDMGNPDCVDGVTEDDCTTQYAGVWTEGLDCGTECPIQIACSNAIQVTLPPAPWPYVDADQTTCGAGDNYNVDTCLDPYYDGGEDIHYELTVTEEVTVNILLTTTSTYTGMAVGTSCPPGPGCLAFATGSSGDKTIESLTLPIGTYYIMIDTWPSPACIDNFTLTIEEDVVPTGACCVYPDCVETNTLEECNAIDGGVWYAGEDCATFECPEPSDVPTLSEWGMIIFTLLLLSVGTVAVIRRRNAVSAREAARS